MHRLSRQLFLTKMSQANDRQLVELLVAYLEKFTTTNKANSRASLLT